MATPPGDTAPAKRDEDGNLKAGIDRKYEKSKYKTKGQSGKSRGAFTRAQQGSYSKETSSGAMRNIHKGKENLDSAVRLSHSLTENQSNFYDEEETKLFKENHEFKTLIDSLEKNHEVSS